jgi:hypothetical protein
LWLIFEESELKMRKSLLAAFAICMAAGVAEAQEATGGPTQLVITYRCPPPRRAAFRQFMTEQGIQRLEHWKQDGLLKEYKFLFNWYVDVDSWDAMAVLTFPSYTQVARWKEIEKTSPGGLPRDALEMAWPLNTYSVDLFAHGADEQPPSPAASVYVVVPYDLASPAEARDYANAYVIPQAKGSIREGILASYSVFLNRYPGGKRWHALLLLEYKDLDSFQRRDEVNAKVRGQLKNDPAWRAAGEKQKPGTEREPVMADPVLAH